MSLHKYRLAIKGSRYPMEIMALTLNDAKAIYSNALYREEGKCIYSNNPDIKWISKKQHMALLKKART